jgi:cytochrome c biogenesis protein CcmG/thiol:disulfide interchange protein DsbE
MMDENTNTEIVEKQNLKWGSILVWVGVLGLLAVLGFGLIRSRQGPVAVGEWAPDFILETFEGEQINTVDLKGNVVVINFWASWCKPCEQEAVELEQAYQKFRDQGVNFIGVAYTDSEPEALAYLSKFNITYPNGPDARTSISAAYRIRGVPETYIVGVDGTLVDVKIGPYMSLGEIETAVENALQK